jgi:DMSO/TMAO reductase YedYZ heme-binding membrane subunit
MAFYALAVISLSFYVKKWIGLARWRAIHYLAFGTFLSAVIHGAMAGTDRTHPAVIALYATSAAVVVALVGVRLVGSVAGPATAPRRVPERG